jgi:phosphoribosylcarboxyaminoimidazole (NCAIR) mutase
MPPNAPSFDIPAPQISLRDRVAKLSEWEKLPIIEVRVGSDSDLPKIKKILEWLGDRPILVRIASAHRTPEAMAEIARAFPEVLIICENDKEATVMNQDDLAMNQRLHVITSIACAGWSAHIAGMTASETETPVTGYPVKWSVLGQLDSDASMRHTPPGIPNGISADQWVIVQMAKNIYDNSISKISSWETQWEVIFINPSIDLESAHQQLITQLKLKISDTLDRNTAIGIYPYAINDTQLKHGRKKPRKVSEEVLAETLNFWVKIPIIIPTIPTALDTDIRTMRNATRAGIVMLNTLAIPGLSMGINLADKVNPTNAILFTAKLVATYSEEVRDALYEYRMWLAHGLWAVRDKDQALVKRQLS